jgi:hypothetical protein
VISQNGLPKTSNDHTHLIRDVVAQKLANTQQAILDDDPTSADPTLDVDDMKQAIEAAFEGDDLLDIGILFGDVE